MKKKRSKVLFDLKNGMVNSSDDMPSKYLAEKLKQQMIEEEGEQEVVRDGKFFAVDSLMTKKKAVDLLELLWFQIL